MSIAGRKAQKSSRPVGSRRSSARKHSNYKRKKSWLSRLLMRFPRWVIWLFGLSVAAAYIVFILQVVLHFTMPWSQKNVDPADKYEVRGIDISHYQSKIDWNILPSARIAGHPIKFVIMKSTEGVSIFDKTFNKNFQQARQHDLIRGAYHFFVPKANAKKQAESFIAQVRLEPGDLPPILDVEKKGRLSKKQLQEAVKTWMKIVGEHYGVKPILYTYSSFKKQYLDDKDFDQYPLWVAHYYKEKLEYEGEWVMWQYTDKGKVLGIEHNVDCNAFNGSLEDLKNLCITEEQYPISIIDKKK